MSLNRTLTTFIIDISESMGRERTVIDETVDKEGRVVETARTTTNLEWALEFVNRKTQAILFSKLKTAKMMLISFGSPRTNNVVIDGNPDTEGYSGIDELSGMGQPTVATLDLLQSLRAVRPGEGGEPPDALAAIIVALVAMTDTERGGVASTAKSWRRTIYLITDGTGAMNLDSVDVVADKIKEDNVSLKVIGIDFDDAEYGFKEEDKDPIKAQNEAWWHSWLSKLPDSRIASAVNALEQVTLPTVQLKTSAPYKTMLTLGDPQNAYSDDGVLVIPVKLFKLTMRALPMSRRTLSKLSEESESARRDRQAAESQMPSQGGALMSTPTPNMPRVDTEEGGGGASAHEVETRRIYFLGDQVKEYGTENASALPEGAEEKFSRAYRLGASLIPITTDLDVQWESTQGLEIINWVKSSTFRRHYLLGEVWNVFADETNLLAQVQLSSLCRAMREQGKVALVRFVRRANAEPKLGVLHPVDRPAGDDGEDASEGQGQGQGPSDYFHFVEVPFSEDLKRYTFPSLDRVVTAEGKELKEHRSLPNASMVSAMEDLVDSMDLMHAFKDEDGQDCPWFATEDSFNPGIHRMKEAVAWRVLHQGQNSGTAADIPRPHWEVDKFLDRPEEIKVASAPAAEKCKKLLNIRYYPDKAMVKARFKRQRDAAEKANRIQYAELDLSLANIEEEGGSGQKATEDPVSAAGQGGMPMGNQGEAGQEGEKRIKIAPSQQQEPSLSQLPSSSSALEDRLFHDDSGTDEEEELLGPAASSSSQSHRAAGKQRQIDERQQQQQNSGDNDTKDEDMMGEYDDDEGEDEVSGDTVRIPASDPLTAFRLYLEDPRMDQGEVIRALQRTIIDLAGQGGSALDVGTDSTGSAWDRARDAMREGKRAAAEYDEALEWNEFLRALKRRSGDEHSTQGESEGDNGIAEEVRRLTKDQAQAFWTARCRNHLDVAGLVTVSEDEGGRSEVTDAEASRFVAF